MKNRKNDELLLQGVTICPGIGMGKVRLADRQIEVPEYAIRADQVSEEQARYTDALDIARHRLHDHIQKAHYAPGGDSDLITEMHEAMLADQVFHKAVRQRISEEHTNAEHALEQEAKAWIKQLASGRNSYLATRAADVRDMANNVLTILVQGESPKDRQYRHDRGAPLLVSQHLYPSSAINAKRVRAAGFATESRALTSHAAILLKGAGIPAVGGIADLLNVVQEGDHVIVDGLKGLIVIHPRKSTIREYSAQKARAEEPAARTPCTTANGVSIRLMANLETLKQVPLMLQHGLEGIGLFRTEFMILPGGDVPDEEEQYSVYRRIIEEAAGRRVIFRTFDIGADKQQHLLTECTGENPAMGVRGLRRHLAGRTQEFRTQLRAIMRAAHGADTGILLPVITIVDDIRAAKEHFVAVKDELRSANLPFSEDISFGAMIEVPAAAIAVRQILAEVDFISIGTNDLLQYFMAADRDNEEVLRYNTPDNGAFLWLLQFIIREAAEVGREGDVTVCGEMASQPNLLSVLIRQGYRSFSISPVAAAAARRACGELHVAGRT